MLFGRKLASISPCPASNSAGSPPEEHILKKGERPCSLCNYFVDDLAIWVPSLDTWDQFVWPLAAAMPQALMEAEQYGYCCGQAVDLGLVMLVVQLRVMDEARTYLCLACALVFKGSVLAYNPARDDAE